APFVIEDSIVLTPKVDAMFDFGVQARLVELGIVTSNSIGLGSAQNEFATSNESLFNGKPTITTVCGQTVLLISSHVPAKGSFRIAALTRVGQEVLSLHSCDLDEEMLRELATVIRTHGFELERAQLMRIVGNTAHFGPPQPLLPPKDDASPSTD